jgi:WD40 repeat protein
MLAPSRTAALALLLLVLTAALAPSARPADDKADAALKALAERCKDVAERDRERLIQDLLAFRRTYPGTPQAVEAAQLQSRLPSALDRLDAAAIPELERFDWQPKELVAVVGEHRGRQGAAATGVAWSADGAVAVSGGGPWVRIWNPATLRLRALLYQYGVLCVAVTRDARTAAAGGSNGAVNVWDLESPDKPVLRCTFTASSGPVYSVAFAPDGKSLAVGCYENTFRVYDVTGKEAKAVYTLVGHDKPVYAVAYAPDGKTLATASADQSVKLWTLGDTAPEEKAVLLGHAKEVAALAFNPAGTLLASGDHSGAIRLWNPASTGKAKEKAVFAATNSGVVHSLSFSADGKTLAAGCGDGMARLWGMGTTPPRERAVLEGHGGAVNGVAWSPDNKQVLTGSGDWTVRSWDVSGAKPKERFQPWSHLSHIYGVAFSPEGQTLASASHDRVLRLWDVTKTEPKTRQFLKGDNVELYAVAFAPDGKSVAAGGNHKNVRQWDAASGRPLRPVTGHPGYVSSLTYSPDGRLLIGHSGKEVLLWTAQKGELHRRLETPETNVNGVALSPDGRHLLSANGNYLIKDGKIVNKPNGTPEYTDCVLRLWDVESGDELFAEKSHTVPIYSVAFSADGKQAYSGALEGQWRRWDVADKKLTEAAPVKAAAGYASVLRASPDGKTVVTLGLDSQLVVWDTAGGRRLKQWPFAEHVGGVAYSSDSRHLAVGLATGVVYILRLEGPAERGAK